MSVPATKTTQKRIRWKAGKEDELWNYVLNRTASGVSISEALKAFADRNGISWLTARWKYYRLKQERESTIEIADDMVPMGRVSTLASVRTSESREDVQTTDPLRPEEAYQALSEFLKSASRIESLDLAGLLGGLGSLSRVALKGEDAIRESASMRQEYNELQQKLAEQRRLLGHARTEYDVLLETASDWLDLHSVDRITMMGEFAKKLQVEIGKVNRALALVEEF